MDWLFIAIAGGFFALSLGFIKVATKLTEE